MTSATRLLTLFGLLVLPGFLGAQVDAPASDEAPPAPLLYARGEYLHWWMSQMFVPVALLTAPSPADRIGDGSIGQNGTVVLLGNGPISSGSQPGGRFTVGAWLDDEFDIRAELSAFLLDSGGCRMSVSDPTGTLRLAAPYIRATGTISSVLVLSGPRSAADVNLSIRSLLLGAELNAVVGFTQFGAVNVDLLGGFRHLYLAENLTYTTSHTPIPAVADRVFTTADEFRNRNAFYGPQLGARLSWFHGPLSAELIGKVSLGMVHQETLILGETRTNAFSPTRTIERFDGGIYAQPTNLGRAVTDVMTCVPEVQVRTGYQFASWLRLSVGYGFLYIDSVARPGLQIDPVISQRQSVAIGNSRTITLAGATRPIQTRGETGLWVQGLNLGLEFEF